MKILILGYRKVLYKELLNYSSEISLIEEKFPFKKERPHFYTAKSKDLKPLIAIASQVQPNYIIAASEKWVLAAALLREEFGLPGENVETSTLCTNKLNIKKKAKSLQI
ncbi:MAG: hypothetical protein KDD37_07625, partial [Bdellovibrionales bacterium]|nr:hypothetical protein [Bdellovibrionales bacterium]